MQRPPVPKPHAQSPERATRGDVHAVAGSPGKSSPARESRVMMIVDDHAYFRSALRHWMTGLDAGYELIEADSGEQAVALAGRQEIHAVLMDLELPGMSGIEATRRIKEILPQIPVIIVSQHAANVYIEQARAAGASGYVLKSRVPDDLEPLLAGISTGGGQSHGAADDRLATPMPALDERQHRVDELVRKEVGLRLREEDRKALAAWTGERLRALSLPGIDRFRELLAEDSAAGRRERELLTVRFTTGESYFFRDGGQFALLATRILPELIERRAAQRTLRVWSAGCAAGEEAYSLAMIVDELGLRVAGWNILILGTDINAKAIEKARNGTYGQWSFRALDTDRKQRYFRQHGSHWQIDPRLRDMVTFRRGDLTRDRFPDAEAGLSEFDLVLCRNVFIYLDAHAVGRITAKFAEALAEGGYLVTGHSELFGHDTAPLSVRMFAQSAVFQKTAQPAADMGLGEALAQAPAHVHAPAAQALRLPPGIEREASRIKQRTVPTALPAAPAEDCDRLMQAAWRHADRGMPDEAEQDCRKAIALAAFDPRPYYLLAQLAQERGDAVQAKALLKKVIYLDPSFIAAYLELGALHARAGESERARRMYETARTALRKLPAKAAVAPYSESSAIDVLAYVESLLGPRAGGAAGSTATQARQSRSE